MDVANPYSIIRQANAPIAVKSVKTYRRDIRSIVRGLWSNVIGFDQAFESFQSTITRHFTQAWHAGAKECSISPDELSQSELDSLREQIIEETQFISGFLEAIEANSKPNGGKIAPLFGRVELWVNKWDAVFELAQSMACADQKAVWILGRTEKHCVSCSGFNGRVYRFSTWHANDALPRSSRLACNGFRCDCRLEQTDRPLNKGRFPASLLQ